MGISNAKNGKLLYHLTKLSNLDSILEKNLLSRKRIEDADICFSDFANPDIISKRKILGLDDYIPFHFHPYSSFDVAVKKTYSSENFIYICISRDLAKHNKFKILHRHPLNIGDVQLMNYEKGFNSIDWDTMHSKGTSNENTKMVKMAECLTDLTIPAKLFHSIGVKDNKTKLEVENSLRINGITQKPPYVDIVKWLQE